jgi:hypothetical protein
MKKIIGIFALMLFVFPLSVMAVDEEWEIDDTEIEDNSDAIVMRV